VNAPMISRALVLCNGEPPSHALIHRLASRSRFIVAADGGANMARAAGIRPDLIIGDLDSVTPATRRHFASCRIIRVARQDNTDLEKALDVLAAEGVGDVTIVGAAGRRLDFTLANFSIAWLYMSRLRIRFAGDGWQAVPLTGRIRLRGPRGTTVSLIPFSACSGITLRGLAYPLTNAGLRGGAVAVSNVVVRPSFTVSVKRGRLLVVLQEKPRRRRRPR
jgi:thiamine pyrophosphokinase